MIHLISIIMMIVFIGCSTPQVTLLKPASDEADKTLLVLNYELTIPENLDWRESCVLKLQSVEPRHLYEAALTLDQKLIQLEVPAGEYRIEGLYCGSVRKWELNNFGAAKVSAADKKVNYLGRYLFRMSVKDNITDLNIERGDREQTLRSLRQTSKQKPGHWRDRLVSAYNGNAIPASYLKDEKSYARGTTSRVVGEKANLNKMNFDACEKAEFKANPAPLGILSYQVVYEKDQWVESKLLQSSNTFSETYITCVEGVMKQFKPGVPGRVEYKVNL